MLKTDFPYFCAMKFKSSCILIAALAFLATFSSCGENKNEKTEKHYVVASLRGPSSVAMIKLIDSLENQEDANIKVEIFNEPLQVRKIMLDGTADFAILPTTMAALLYNKGLDYRMTAVPLRGTLYLCGNDTTIQTWDDLRGKKVYLMAKGMTPDVMFQHLLIENGLQPYDDVDLDYRFPTHIDLANATLAGRAELSVISEPYLSQALLENDNLHILMDLSEEWNKTLGIPLCETAVLCKSSLAESHDKTIEQFNEAYQRSAIWVNAHPDSAALLSVKHGIIADSLAVVNSIPRSHIEFTEMKDAQTEVEAYLKVFYDMQPEIIGEKMPDERFYQK